MRLNLKDIELILIKNKRLTRNTRASLNLPYLSLREEDRIQKLFIK